MGRRAKKAPLAHPKARSNAFEQNAKMVCANLGMGRERNQAQRKEAE